MRRQPKYKPLDPSPFFADGRSSRPRIPDTVASSDPLDDELLTGRRKKSFATEFPFPVDRAVLERGRRLFETHCAICHDRTGMGNGIVVQNGYPHPPAYTDDLIMGSPPGFYAFVVTKGYGKMFPYAGRVKPADRWAIAAYIEVLQLAGHARVKELPARDRAALEASR